MTFTVPTCKSAGRCCGGSRGGNSRCYLIPYLRKKYAACLACLFLWLNFTVPLQLLGRMVSDCPSLGDLFGCRRFTDCLCNQVIVVLFSGKMC